MSLAERNSDSRQVGFRSRHNIQPFELVRSTSVEAAIAARRLEGSVFIAGGLDLIDSMKAGARPKRVISLTGIGSLRGIQCDAERVRIGALTTHEDIASSDDLRSRMPDLQRLWQEIANPRIRHTGSVGGNLMSSLPHYDAAPTFAALGARVEGKTLADEPVVVPSEQLMGSGIVLLQSIVIEAPEQVRLLVDRSLHPVVALYLCLRRHGTDIRLRAAVGSAYAEPTLVPLDAITQLQDCSPQAAADYAHHVVSNLPEPIDDGLASASYRRRMTEVTLRRLLVEIGERA